MKRTNIYTVAIIIFIAILLAVGGYMLYKRNYTGAQSYVNTEYGVSFNYPNEYRLEEDTLPDDGGTVVTLTKKYHVTPKNGEKPTNMEIAMYPNQKEAVGKTPVLTWITTSPYSNFKLSAMKSPGTTQLAGQDALLYTWDGLYPATTVVTKNDDAIVMMTVMYDGQTDSGILKDFTDLVESVILEQPGYATSSMEG